MTHCVEFDLRPPWWQRGGHAQTIAAALVSRTTPSTSPLPQWQRARWTSPDGDFIDVDTCWGAEKNPHVVLLHGLEGSSSSHYARAWAQRAQARGWTLRVVHFRGCSGEINRLPRAYHSGDAAELDWILRRAQHEASPNSMFAVGYSLGGNVLAKWLGTCARLPAAASLRAAAVIAAPLNLRAAGEAIDQGLNRWIYTPMFLRTMRAKAKAKWAQYPGLFDLSAVMAARSIRAFDDAFTAPLHGFAGVDDYWCRASAQQDLANISTPTCIINARNDPFVPIDSVLPAVGELGDAVSCWQPTQGGHAGFAHQDASTGWRGGLWAVPEQLLNWFSERLTAYG